MSPQRLEQAPKVVMGPGEAEGQIRVMAGQRARMVGEKWLDNGKRELG